MGLFAQNNHHLIAPRQKALEAVPWKWRPQQPADEAAPRIHLTQQKVGTQKLQGGALLCLAMLRRI